MTTNAPDAAAVSTSATTLTAATSAGASGPVPRPTWSPAAGDSWLPPLLLFSDHNGNWHAYVDALYTAFCDDFLHTRPAVPGRDWAVKRYPEAQGKAATFWHIISEKDTESGSEDDRLPDPRRCERIRWPRPLVDALGNPALRCWRTRRGRSERVCIALDDFSYLIVLEDRKKYIMLWTAFCVERGHRRAKFRKEYEQWVRSGASLL